MQQLAKRADGGWTPRLLGSAFGFVLTVWGEGRPLMPSDASTDLLARMGR